MADVVKLIMDDHRTMEGLFEKLRSGEGDRQALLEECAARLTAHSRAEEERVYPVITEKNPSESGEVHHGYQEHQEADELLHRLQGTDPQGPEFDRALAELVDAVKHHIEEEESKILPALAEAVSRNELEELGRAFMERRKEELRAHKIDDDVSRAELYKQAQEAGIAGRSQMSKEELARELRSSSTG
ncbi:MAG TPA: hemerythrin domain-containing protein [Micromonosporaceae bacterium]|nr:hemerythrin domain-containing protein [Micromonosporaceae bacterium]